MTAISRSSIGTVAGGRVVSPGDVATYEGVMWFVIASMQQSRRRREDHEETEGTRARPGEQAGGGRARGQDPHRDSREQAGDRGGDHHRRYQADADDQAAACSAGAGEVTLASPATCEAIWHAIRHQRSRANLVNRAKLAAYESPAPSRLVAENP